MLRRTGEPMMISTWNFFHWRFSVALGRGTVSCKILQVLLGTVSCKILRMLENQIADIQKTRENI